MLKRHQACIDLAQNALIIQGRKVRFLAEHEIPKNALLEYVPTSDISSVLVMKTRLTCEGKQRNGSPGCGG